MHFDISGLVLGRLYTRPALADLWGYASFHAIARGVVTPQNSNCIILFVTNEKQSSLTQYRDFINGNRLHWEGELGHATDDRIATAQESGDDIHLFYRDLHHMPFRYLGQLRLIRFTRRRDRPSSFLFSLIHDLGPDDDVRSHETELAELDETEREAVVQARVGQGRFRDDLLKMWGGCAITGVNRPQLLRASHIKPWRLSSNRERLDQFNGLLLLPQYDHLFDRGYITFDDEGRLELSPAIVSLPADHLGIRLGAQLRSVSGDHLPFLRFHRREVFLAGRGTE